MEQKIQQFVIQEHRTSPGLHWDLMLQMGEVLWTWQLDTPPQDIHEQPIAAERIVDHPLRFLTYEGPVQNGSGRVRIADKGTYLLLEQSDITLIINAQGQWLNGQVELSQTDDGSRWTLCIKKE